MPTRVGSGPAADWPADHPGRTGLTGRQGATGDCRARGGGSGSGRRNVEVQRIRAEEASVSIPLGRIGRSATGVLITLTSALLGLFVLGVRSGLSTAHRSWWRRVFIRGHRFGALEVFGALDVLVLDRLRHAASTTARSRRLGSHELTAHGGGETGSPEGSSRDGLRTTGPPEGMERISSPRRRLKRADQTTRSSLASDIA